MSRTFLQLCQKVCREVGIPQPSAVTNQTGLLAKVVDWVADADEQIQTKWSNWDFLWSQFQTNTIAGTSEYSAPSDLGSWDHDSFYLDYTSDSYQRLSRIDYRQWRHSYRNGTKTNATPDFFVVTPAKNIILESPPDAVYSLTADYWKSPTVLSANTDTSAIPARFERVIIARAKMFYAEHESAPEVMQVSLGEYNEIMNRMEADQLPGQEDRRKSNAGFVVRAE